MVEKKNTQRLGIDIGGTFTDLTLYNEDSKDFRFAKTPTTPGDPFEGLRKGIEKLGISVASLSDFVHGTTVGTNAVIQKKGPQVSMITTKGHAGVLAMDGAVRSVLYDIRGRRPDPLVRRSRIYEVTERALVDGTIMQPLDQEELRQILSQIAKTDAKAIAICFVASQMQNQNEMQAKALVQEILPDLFTSVSSEISKHRGEFERFSTTVLNSYIGPLVYPYLKKIVSFLTTEGYRGSFWITVAGGGAAGVEQALAFPIFTVNSGPAAGVAATSHLAELLGLENVISYDMGGTSTDVCLIKSFRPPTVRDIAVSGYPNTSPQLDINAIGAGGGSIAWVDIAGEFKVGPMSQGANPGPACYNLGGTEATITDATLLLGWLNSKEPLVGEIALHPELSREAVSRIGHQLGVTDEYRMAEAITDLVTLKMVGAVKEVSTGKGYDVRDFALIAYGGAGPMFATGIASQLGIKKVVSPVRPGHFCSTGMLQSNVFHQYSRPVRIMTSEVTVDSIRSIFAELRKVGEEQLIDEGFGQDNMHFEERLSMKYPQQHYELEIPMAPSIEEVEKAFYAAHEERFQFAFAERLMIMELIVDAWGLKEKARITKVPTETEDLAGALKEIRPAQFAGSFVETPIYRRDDVPEGVSVKGPVIFEELGSTTVVQPGWIAHVDNLGNLILENKG
jgi:N-methylhydantoinase A